jgi:glycosyltransferase involved in cell wall biosynthesis
MKILFLLSSLEPAGSETYCVALARAWGGRHDIHWISPQLHFGQTYTSLPIHKKSFPVGYQNVWHVYRYIKNNGIDVIHSHARRAHWVASHAARWAKIPHVTTIHQPPPVHFFSKLSPCLGDHTIAINENVVTHLKRHFPHGLKKLHMIRNGIDLSRHTPTPMKTATVREIAVMGRMSGNRWRAVIFLLNVLEKYAKELPPARYRLAGHVAPELADDVRTRVAKASSAVAPSSVVLEGYTDDVPGLLNSVHGVIGAGRSAMEALASERPLLVLGERGLVGFLDETTLPQALATNFGDHFEDRVFPMARMAEALKKLLLATDGSWGRTVVQKYYNVVDVAPSVEAVYAAARSPS